MGAKFLFAGKNVVGENLIYPVNQSGQLLSCGNAGTAGNVPSLVTIGFGGWEAFKSLFACANETNQNRIYAVVAERQ
jgi:hypothetical protein